MERRSHRRRLLRCGNCGHILEEVRHHLVEIAPPKGPRGAILRRAEGVGDLVRREEFGKTFRGGEIGAASADEPHAFEAGARFFCVVEE